MRTNIEIDDKLMKKAMRSTGTTTKRAAVAAALQLVVDLHSQTAVRKNRGKIQWEGNLDESRLARFIEE